MAAPHQWMYRSLAVAVILLVAGANSTAQVIVQQKANPNSGGVAQPKSEQPKSGQSKNSFTPTPIPLTQAPSSQKQPSAYLMPSINSWSGIPNTYQQAIPSFWNPAIDNQWMDQFTIRRVPAKPFNTPFAMNPFLSDPLFLNPLLFNRPFNYPLGVPGYRPSSVFSPQTPDSPSIAIQEPEVMKYREPDVQVNPTSSTVYQPTSGIVTLADGSTFYRVPGSGVATTLSDYIPGSGPSYNPMGGSFFNPSSGTFSKPAHGNTFMPYVW